MSSVAVVILNYNGRPFLEKFLPSVIQNSKGYRIVVADNCSTDDSIDFLESQEVDIIKLEENHGYAGGYKEALQQLDEEYFVLLNSDVEVSPEWLTPMVRLIENDPKISAVQPKILSFTTKSHFEYAGAGGGFIDWMGYPFCRGRIFLQLEEDKGQYDDTIEIFWASGACMLVRASAMKEAGGLDEDFFAHMEEIDLCWRMKNLDYKIMYCGKSTVYHVGGGTLSASNPKKTYLNFRNGIYMLLKNKRTYQLLYALPMRWALDWIAAIKFTLLDSPADGWAVIRAHFSVLGHAGKIIRKRKGAKRKSRLHGIFWRSIVWARFVRGIKKYEDLNQRV